jgi:hypothetical protein
MFDALLVHEIDLFDFGVEIEAEIPHSPLSHALKMNAVHVDAGNRICHLSCPYDVRATR